MKYKQYVIVNSLIAVFLITLMVMFGVLLDINVPAGLVMFLIMGLVSVGALLFVTFYLATKHASPSGLILINAATYIFQLAPFIIFFLASDNFVSGKLIMIPIVLMFLFIIAYVAVILLFTYFNKITKVHDEKISGEKIEVQKEADYFNEDGSFKGAK